MTYLPSPADRPFEGVDAKGDVSTCTADNTQPAVAWVWKSIADPFAGQITMLRVVSGVPSGLTSCVCRVFRSYRVSLPP